MFDDGMSTGYLVTEVSLHAIGFTDVIQPGSSFPACDEDAASFSRCSNGQKAAATPNLNRATSIHLLVAEMPLDA